ncbi:murein transglycosylase A [Altericroceibacterium indicum]|nr:murein transglycosylase A [Altericroceibacterium indicum]
MRAGGVKGCLATLAGALFLFGCGQVVPPSQQVPPKPPIPPTAVEAGVAAGPPIASLKLTKEKAASALRSFVESCPVLLRRQDASGLTQAADWQPACDAAPSVSPDGAVGFFQTYFETVRVYDGAAYVTGYYEPEIAGVRQRQPGFDVPVYALPDDLVRRWSDDVPQSERVGRPPLARIDESGKVVPYYTRAEIEDGALANRGLEIAWVADPVEFFFLQIQGSGRIRTPDGAIIRIGYAGQNGWPYTGIGSVMRERGLFGTGPGQYPASMQGIMQYLREHPREGDALMRMNASWVFFRELTGDGPLGALGVPVRPQASVAADPKYVPLGAPVFLKTDRKEVNHLWIAQDTGGAIKGPNRLDSFWGAGDYAREIAGGMSARGEALVLVPVGTLAKLQAR